MNPILKQLKKQLTKDYGKPCKDFTPLCSKCVIWRAFSDLQSVDEVLGD